MDSISDTAIELQQAVRQALAIIATVDAVDSRTTSGTTGSNSLNNEEGVNDSIAASDTFTTNDENDSIDKYRKCANTFERKRCLRRIERSVIAFYKEICLFRESHGDNGIEDFATAEAVLDDGTLECLIDIITELPKLDNFVKSSTFEEIYSEIISLVCSVIQQCGIASLNPNQIDRLLDRVATLALQEEVDVDVLQLLNATLLYRMQMPVERHQEQHDSSIQPTSWGEHDVDYMNGTNEQDYSDVPFDQVHKSRVRDEAESAIILNAIETIRLTQLLIPLSLRFFSHPWTFIPQEGEFHCESTQGNLDHSQATWSEQHGGLQLRILLHHLLEHFMHQVIETNSGQSQDQTLNFYKLERFLLQLFEREILATRELGSSSSYGHGSEHGLEIEAIAEEAKEMVEDFIDLLSSFVVENIEFAIDAIDTSSHGLGQYVRVNLKGDSVYRKSENKNALIYRYFKDTIRLSSLACGLIELFGVLHYSFESHAKKLLEAHATFIACYCNDDFMTNIDGAGVMSIDFADNLLLRLYICVENHSNIHMGKGSMFAEASSSRAKRRRTNIAPLPSFSSAASLNETALVTFLRAFYQSSVKDNEMATDLLAIEMQKFKNLIHDDNGGPENESLIHEYSTLIQACALSVLKSPGQFKAELFSLLMNSFLSIGDLEHGGEQREIMYGSNSRILDVTNPWNFLICRSLSEKMDYATNQTTESSPAITSATISTSSTVSDVRSHNTSSSGIQLGRLEGQITKERILKEISLIFGAFPEPINTLLA